jgi:hypothetical protein
MFAARIGIVAHNGHLHAVDIVGLSLSVLVAVVALTWLAVGFLRKRYEAVGFFRRRHGSDVLSSSPEDPWPRTARSIADASRSDEGPGERRSRS